MRRVSHTDGAANFSTTARNMARVDAASNPYTVRELPDSHSTANIPSAANMAMAYLDATPHPHTMY